jgi:high-affinity iron transporter
LTVIACLGSPLAGQALDSLGAARRYVAAVSLAAREYAAGVAPAGGRVVSAEEIAEAKLFLAGARYDAPLLPRGVAGDSALDALTALFERSVPPAEVDRAVAALTQRLERATNGAIIPAPAHPPSAARGAVVYREQCAYCHGDAGRGDGPKARSLTGPPPSNLTDSSVVGVLTQVDLYRKITFGVAGTAMPEYEPTLSEDDRWAVAAYVATLPYGGSHSAGVFAAVRRTLDSSVALHSRKLAFDAYLTFEQIETDLRATHPALTSQIEGLFAQLRHDVEAGNEAQLRADHRNLLAALEHAERAEADKPSAANLLLNSFLVLLREGFEAILLIAALMTFLTKAGAVERRGEVAAGAWAAVAASILTAVAFELLLTTTPGQREALEGITMLVATGVLFYVSYWLLSKIEADKWNAFLKSRMQAALTSGSRFALASVAFLAVYREGVETILFYKALLASGGAGGAGPVVAGVALGAVALVIVYVVIMRLGLRIALKPFFAVTGLLLYYLAFVFAGRGVAELQEAGMVGTTVVEWAPRVPVLGIYPTVQSLLVQGVLLVLLIVALLVSLRPRRARV